jgi:hypothetical protein
METKYIKQYIEDMEGDKRADNLTEFGECLLKELKQLLSVCEQKETEQQSNCNLPHVSNNEVAVCEKKNCNEPVYEFGLCFKHYCISEE